MRPIKFRAWDKIKKEWWCDLIFIRASDGKCMLEEGSYEPPIETDFELVQFTGLKDKNGKEIYEGDIIHSSFRRPHEEIYEVRWIVESAEFSIQHKDICEKYIEVIGNIYENRELLKDRK